MLEESAYEVKGLNYSSIYIGTKLTTLQRPNSWFHKWPSLDNSKSRWKKAYESYSIIPLYIFNISTCSSANNIIIILVSKGQHIKFLQTVLISPFITISAASIGEG